MNILKLCLAGVSLTAATGAFADVTLTMNSWLPPTHPQVAELYMPWIEDVERVTEGRVKIEILPAPLGPPPAAFDLAKNGVVDIAYGVQGYSPNRFRTAVLGEMPFLSDDAVATSVAFQRVHSAMLEEVGEYEGVKVLGVFTHGPGAIYSREPIETADDIEGQKIRIGGIFAHDIASSLGAVPVEGPASQAYELLSQGVADGIFFPAESVTFFNLADESAVANRVLPIQCLTMVALVVPHDPRWKMAFEDEAKAIKHAFGNSSVQVHHIGSTAIPGILAKPIIDLLGVVSSLDDVDAKARVFEGLGYEVMGAYGIEGRRYFRKLDSNGTRTHHLHVFEEGSPHAERHFAFRDYLIAHPKVANEYSSLKERLTRGDAPTWDAYLDGKDPFVSRVEPLAVDWFRRLKR